MFVDPGFGVYVDSESSRFHFDHLENLKFNYTNYYRNLDEFKSKSFNSSVAAFHVPFPPEPTWIERFKQVYDLVDQVFVFCSELHQDTVDQLYKIDRQRVSFYLCGVLNEPLKNGRAHHWLDWFHTSSEFYARTFPGFLDTRLHPYDVKPKSFDVLLGNQRDHRQIVHNYLVRNNLLDQNIVTYHKFSHIKILENSEFIQETEGVEYYPDRTYMHSVDCVKYYGHDLSLSQIIPIQIYNQTAYTVVTETNCDNSYNFYTEKIVKPMLARRLFIAIAGKDYLKNLRQLGFKTFDGIIDESYDTVADNITRWNMALEQMSWLMQQDQTTILKQIEPIVEHNYRLITKLNWYSKFSSSLENELINYTKVGPLSIT